MKNKIPTPEIGQIFERIEWKTDLKGNTISENTDILSFVGVDADGGLRFYIVGKQANNQYITRECVTFSRGAFVYANRYKVNPNEYLTIFLTPLN